MRGGPNGQAIFAREVFGKDTARLHGDGSEALIDHALLYDPISFLEGSVHVAIFQAVGERLIAFELLMDVRSVFAQGLLHVGDHGQRFIIHFHEFSGIASGIQVLGNDHSNRLAHVTYSTGG